MNFKLGLPSLCLAMVSCAGLAIAVDNPEVEPNETKAQATVTALMDVGDTISGTTTGTSTSVAGPASADTFLVKVAAAAPGIYRYRLVLTSATVGHTLTIRGLGQTAGVPNTTDATVQTGSTTLVSGARTIQWYGFGKSEELYVRVTGGATTTAPYSAVLERVAVTPSDITGVVEGSVTLREGAGSTQDTDFWVYDSNLDAIPDFGHDDADATGLVRNFAAGQFYVAWANFNTANNLGSPADDTFRTANVMDFPNVVVNTSSTNITNANLDAVHFGGTSNLALSRTSAFDINWVSMLVAPQTEPTNPSCIVGVAPATVRNDGTSNQTVITVTVTPGQNPTSVSHAVSADLSFLGGPVNASFIEGPTDTFSYVLDVASGTPAGPYTITTNVQELSPNSRTSFCSTTLNVIDPPTGSCCIGGDCVILTEAECANAEGLYGGDNTICNACSCSEAPLNDSCVDAILIPSDGTPVDGSTCNATLDGGGTCGTSITTPGVWYKVAGTGNTMVINTCTARSYDTKISVFCGDCTTGLTCITGNDDSCSLGSQVTFCTQAGADYYVLVHGFGGQTGTFTLTAVDSGTSCTPTISCLPTGACCVADVCSITTEIGCAQQGGTYNGDNTNCGGFTATDDYVSADTPIAILDNATATATITIPSGSGTVSGLNVRLDINHTFVGDLIISLSNGVNSAFIMNSTGLGSNLAGSYVFGDAATEAFIDAVDTDPVPQGYYQPVESLSVFDGQPLEGTWTLTVTDDAGLDTGTLNAFAFATLTFDSPCGSACPVCAADFDQDGGITGADVEAFFISFEAGEACADVDLDGGVTGADVETFFGFFEAGGC